MSTDVDGGQHATTYDAELIRPRAYARRAGRFAEPYDGFGSFAWFDDLRAMSGLPPIATEMRTLLEGPFRANQPCSITSSAATDARLAGRRGPRGAAAAHAAGGGWRPEELGTVRRLQHMLRYGIPEHMLRRSLRHMNEPS